jgi:hypothetical protein
MRVALIPCSRLPRVPPLAAGLGLVWLAGIGAHRALAAQGGTTPCVLHLVTGVPCPTCGGTRAAEHLVRGDWSAALGLNPLVTLALLLAFSLLSLRLLGRRAPRVEATASFRRAAGIGLLAALLANWAYVLLRLP